ncbi:hypothetical protein BD626DRAFT_487701 [Schizophyllum amplum]|uniref:Uncharacterized protein n=1 Tax=Schizophyllum amplum TaxID=97359 RepID=A0A550CNM4_9AGAR|nr:hypothetical protein BD626DRAFT_487701 [Auriculariopsis ampla]
MSDANFSGTDGKTRITLPRPPIVTDEEARMYYAGLPSRPTLVARSSTTPWEAPTDPEAYARTRRLRPPINNKFADVWHGDLVGKVIDALDEKRVLWTSLDVVRIAYDEQLADGSAPDIIWIGVKPGTLSREVGVDVVVQCEDLLIEYGVDDVDVEIRESIVVRG